MKKALAVIRNIIFVLSVLLICAMIFIMSSGKHISIVGYQVLRVITSSMEPAIAENTCIIIKECDTEQLEVGDIITFVSDDPQIQGYYNTHRIYSIVEENGISYYVTKGDATTAVDAYPVRGEQIAGKFVRELPGGRLLGKMFLALSDNRVYFLVIMLPLMICLLSYFWQIVGFVTGRYDEDKDEDEDDDEEDNEDDDEEAKDDKDEDVVYNDKENHNKYRDYDIDDENIERNIKSGSKKPYKTDNTVSEKSSKGRTISNKKDKEKSEIVSISGEDSEDKNDGTNVKEDAWDKEIKEVLAEAERLINS